LLYVAATRAREHLILSGGRTSHSRSRKTWVNAIVDGLGGEEALVRVPELEIVGDGGSPLPGDERISVSRAAAGDRRSGAPLPESWTTPEAAVAADAILSRAALSSPPTETSPYLAAASEIVQHHLCPRRAYLRYQIGAPPGLISGKLFGSESLREF